MVGEDVAVFDEMNLVGMLEVMGVMGDEKDRLALLVEMLDGVDEMMVVLLIHPGIGFIEDQKGGFGDERFG